VFKLARFISLYRRHFRDHRRERMFLASSAFFLTFGIVRALVYLARLGDSQFRVLIAGIHVHHLVWGILLLLAVGYLWLIQADHPSEGEASRLGRWSAIFYGAGAALTLDEFALWLHLDDVYFDPAGRLSVDVTVLFGALVSAGLWGGPFLRACVRQVRRMLHRPAVSGPRREEPAIPIVPIELPALVLPVEEPVEGSATP